MLCPQIPQNTALHASQVAKNISFLDRSSRPAFHWVLHQKLGQYTYGNVEAVPQELDAADPFRSTSQFRQHDDWLGPHTRARGSPAHAPATIGFTASLPRQRLRSANSAGSAAKVAMTVSTQSGRGGGSLSSWEKACGAESRASGAGQENPEADGGSRPFSARSAVPGSSCWREKRPDCIRESHARSAS